MGRLDCVSSGVGCVPARPARLCAKLRGDSKAVFTSGACDPLRYRAGRPPERRKTQGRHCGGGHWQIHCKGESASRARPGGVARRHCPAALRCTPPAPSAQCCRPRRVAAPGDADRTNRAGVFADATPTEEFRDVMVPNAPGLKTISLFPHNIASPAGRSEAALAARLGVLPQCRSACSSMPPTPRKSG